MTPRVGIAIPPEGPLSELVAIAVEAENLGCQSVWVNDDRLQKDVFTVLAAIAANTRILRLGPGVTNPYSRHPALLATAIATLDELSGGRAVLGLGAGGTNHAQLGLERVAPATGLREAIEIIRRLLAGEVVTVDGRVMHAYDAELDFTPPRAEVPLYVGSRGPKVLEMAGELADGVIVGNVAASDGWAYALRHIDAGCRRAGRDPDDVALSAWVACAVADDSACAIDAVRPLVATSLVTSRPILADMGIALPPAFARQMEATGWSLSRRSVVQAGREVPVDLVRRFAIAGTVSECRTQVEALLARIPRITELAMIPFSVSGQRITDVVHSFCTDVIAATADV